MNTLAEKIRATVAPEGVFTLDPCVRSIIDRTISRLPNADGVTKEEARCPTTPSGVRANLERLFVRHMLQVQDSLLLDEPFSVLKDCCGRGSLRIVDVGCGPAAAAIAVVDLAAKAAQLMPRDRSKPLSVDIILNDVSEPALIEAKALLRKTIKAYPALTLRHMVAVEVPFPRSAARLDAIADLIGSYDFGLMSYALDLVKEDTDYSTLATGLNRVAGVTTCGIILQDKFHEAIARRLAASLEVPCNKVTMRQEIHDPANSNDEQNYTFFRSILTPHRKSSRRAEKVLGAEPGRQSMFCA